jgi:hypothetical protein
MTGYSLKLRGSQERQRQRVLPLRQRLIVSNARPTGQPARQPKAEADRTLLATQSARGTHCLRRTHRYADRIVLLVAVRNADVNFGLQSILAGTVAGAPRLPKNSDCCCARDNAPAPGGGGRSLARGECSEPLVKDEKERAPAGARGFYLQHLLSPFQGSLLCRFYQG